MRRAWVRDFPATRGQAQAAPRAAHARLARARSLPAWRDEPLVWAGAQIALVAGAVALQASQPLNHDVGWLLIGARRLLAGAPLYSDGFIDVNPPGILVLFAPAVAAAQALALPEIFALRIWLLALCAASLALCHRLASRLFVSEPTVLLRAWLLVSSFVLLVLPNRDFGQREHVIVLLLLPYLLNAALRARGDALSLPLAAGIGAGAGVAAAMKPQYALIVAVAELFILTWRRNWRAVAGVELGVFGCVVAGSAAAVAWFYPDYFRFAVPLAADTYGAYQSPLEVLVRGRDLVLLAAALFAAALWRPGPARPLALIFGGASAAAWIAYLIGGTWWDYHRYPFRAFAFAMLGLGAARLLSRRVEASRLRPSRLGAVAGGAMAFALTTALLLAAPYRIGETLREGGSWRAGKHSGAMAEIEEVSLRRGKGGAIWLPASSVDPAFPAVNYTGVEWASRLSCLWPLPAVIRAKARLVGDTDPARLARLDEIARWIVTIVSEDLERAKPRLIFIPHTRDNLGLEGVGFDFLAYFVRKPRFARIWSQYAWVEDTSSFRVFARQEPEPASRVLTSAR